MPLSPAAEVPNPAKWRGPMRIGPLMGFLWWTMRHGGLRMPKIKVVSTYGDGATLDVPGAPKVTLTPGHTPGSATLHFGTHRALVVGDAMATLAVTTGKRGPQLAPFTADYEQAMASLDRLADIDADLLLPGHGDEWNGSPADAAHTCAPKHAAQQVNAERELRWGVLSTANIGRRKVVPAMQNAKRTRIVAVASRDAERATAYARELGIPRTHGSYEAFLKDPGVDAVYVPLPNHMHAAGRWPPRRQEARLCEKPLG